MGVGVNTRFCRLFVQGEGAAAIPGRGTWSNWQGVGGTGSSR